MLVLLLVLCVLCIHKSSTLGCVANRYTEIVGDLADQITDGGGRASKKQRHGPVCTVVCHNQRARITRFGDVAELNLFDETRNFSTAIWETLYHNAEHPGTALP